MKKNLLIAVALVAGPLLWASAAQAGLEITLGDSTSGAISFTSVGNNSQLDVTFTSSPFIGAATVDGATPGTYSLSAFSPATVVATLSGENFTFDATETFDFSDPAGDMLAGTVTWNQITDNSFNPSLHNTAVMGNLAVSSCSGMTPGFQGTFCNPTDIIDYTFTTLGTPLDMLVTQPAGSTGSTESAGISSGEVTPAPPIGHGLLVLLVVGGMLFGGELWGRGKKLFSLGAAA
jgi:hypothetical protein